MPGPCNRRQRACLRRWQDKRLLRNKRHELFSRISGGGLLRYAFLSNDATADLVQNFRLIFKEVFVDLGENLFLTTRNIPANCGGAEAGEGEVNSSTGCTTKTKRLSRAFKNVLLWSVVLTRHDILSDLR